MSIIGNAIIYGPGVQGTKSGFAPLLATHPFFMMLFTQTAQMRR